MGTGRIDFISAYCDRWCERCAFTARCSVFACEAAIASAALGREPETAAEVRRALELAMGIPETVADGGLNPEQEFLATLQTDGPTAAELAEHDRREALRSKRIKGAPLTRMALTYAMRVHRWLKGRDAAGSTADAVLAEAILVVTYDSHLMPARLHRALDGRDRYRYDGEDDEGPVQNDWNGSAKVALISVERSEAAWRAIAGAGSDREAAALAEALTEMRAAVDREFPGAMSFVRPGFDEPGR